MSIELDSRFLKDIMKVQVNEPAVNRKVNEIRAKAKALEGDNRRAWLLKAIGFIDLTTLAGDDTYANVDVLCHKAVDPVQLPSELEWKEPLHTAAVCVYPSRVKDAVHAIKKYGEKDCVSVASVAGGFPSGQYPLSSRKREIEFAVKMGAKEIDIVIDRAFALSHEWQSLLSDLINMVHCCGTGICVKTILSTGELFSLKDVYIASMIAIRAGTNFIKTSTGKETVNATLPVGIVMCRAIKQYYHETNEKIGFKPAGGIKTAQEALEWMVLIETELGSQWLTRDLFRIGASSLLDNIVDELVEN